MIGAALIGAAIIGGGVTPATTIPHGWNAMKNALQTWATEATRLPAIWKKQDAPALPLSSGYTSLDVIGPPQRTGSVETRNVSSSAEVMTRIHRWTAEFVLNIQLHSRTDLTAIAAELEAMLSDSDVLAPLRAAGLIYTGEHTVNDLDEIAGARWEQRLSLDLRFRVGGLIEIPGANWIEHYTTTIGVVGEGIEGQVGA